MSDTERAAPLATSTTRYEIAGAPYDGAFVHDPTMNRPALLMAPDWMGVSDGALAMARTVAGWGYAVFVADLYGAGKRPASMQEAIALSEPLKSDQAEVRVRMHEALRAVRERKPCTSAFGFCFGGMNVLELARSGADLDLAVSIHGDLLTTRPSDPGAIKGEIVVLHGADDPVAPKAQRDAFEAEMTAAGATWLMATFGRTVHSFTDPAADVPGVAQLSSYAADWALAVLRRAIEKHCGK